MTKNNSFLKIDLISEDGAENRFDNDWQIECKKLNTLLSDKISSYDAKVEAQAQPHVSVKGEAVRAGGAFDFTSLILSAASSEMVASIGGVFWDTLTKWMERRKSCSCVIRIDDSEYHLNNLTKDELIEIMTSHQSNPKI